VNRLATLVTLAIAVPASADDYGRAGLYEVGGSAGLLLAPDVHTVTVAPAIGWFVADNFEISGLLDASKIDGVVMVSSLVEPSYHVPITRRLFGFLGMGIGYAYLEDRGGALAMAPRIGANLCVGRSGVISPSLSYGVTTHANPAMEDAAAVTAGALRINLGFTSIW
jgi:hypothetical protein